MLDKVGKAAVIHSTGTGKSMIAFRLVETHPDAQFPWLAPSTYIYHTQLENLQRMIGDSDTESLLEHVTFMTYSKLMHDEDIIDSIQRITLSWMGFIDVERKSGEEVSQSFLKLILRPSCWGFQQPVSVIWIISAIWRRSCLMAALLQR